MIALATIDLPTEVTLTSLGRTSPIAAGGSGSIEAVDARPATDEKPLVLKRFHRPELVAVEALDALVRWHRDLAYADRAQLDRIAAWPLAIVRDRGRFVGFLMPRVPERFSERVRLPSGRRRATLREAQYLLASPARTGRLGIDDPAPESRLEVVWALAEAVAFLHRHRIVIGDLSTRNVLWRSDPGEILLVDCDSFTLGGVGSPLPATFTVDWDDPAQPNAFAASSDVYKLALFVLRALGRSFQARDASVADGVLDPTGRWLLRASLDPDPEARPTAATWERWAAGRRATTSARAASTRPDPTNQGSDVP